jgi:alpha-1,3-rhamnosyl/mannosyltransferase
MPTPRPEIYHEPNFLPYRFPGPTVITAHDLSWIRYPQTHPAERVAAMNDLFPAALERAAHVITDAAYVRDEIMAEFGIAPERITSIPLGAREIFHPRPATDCCAVLAARGLAYRGYALCVGTLEPRKNLETALRAHARLDPSLQRDMPLAIVGMKGWRTTSLERALAPRVESGVVRPLGYVDDADLPALYAGALALVYPSIYEGFGLPPLEAMACGTPVIVSNRSSLPEVVGDAGILVEPEDETAIASALERLRDDPAYRAERSQAGLARASMYSWDRTARETLAVYRRVLASAA